MASKMKGLLKGLRYISNIFEAEEKEAEMQIGFPTDVKHVAHIGWDGPAAATPGSSEPLAITAVATARSEPKIISKSPSRDVRVVSRSSTSRDLPAMPLPKPSKRIPSSSAAAATGGANSESLRTSRPSRRHQSSATSPDRDKSDSSRRGRRDRSATSGSDMSTYESSLQQDQKQPAAASATKQRRRKVKGSSTSSSSSSSSSRPSRSKAADGKAKLPPAKGTRDDVDEDED